MEGERWRKLEGRDREMERLKRGGGVEERGGESWRGEIERRRGRGQDRGGKRG